MSDSTLPTTKLFVTSACPRQLLRESLTGLRAMFGRPLDYFVRLMLDNRHAAIFRLGPNRVIMLNDQAGIRRVMLDNSKNYIKSHFYRPLRSIMGAGMIMSEGAEWLAQRRAAAPQFAGQSLEGMAGPIVASVAAHLDEWEKRLAGASMTIDIGVEMLHLAFSTAMSTLFNVSLSAAQREDIYTAFSSVLKVVEHRTWSLVNIPLFIDEKINPHYRRAIPLLTKVVSEIIAARRADPKPPNDLLTRLIADADARGCTPKQLREQVLLMILVSYETNVITMAWMWYTLSTRPDIERKLHKEIDEVLQGRRPVYADLRKLQYTRMVFEETLRFYPPVWTMSRTAVDDDVITLSDGRQLPVKKGMHVMLCTYAMHRHPDYWDNPEGFDPERFADERERTNRKYCYFPFGGGPRNCLGDRFASMEIVLIMAMVAQRFRLQLVPGQKIEPLPMTTLRPERGIMMQVGLRHQQTVLAPPLPAVEPEVTVATCPFHSHSVAA